MTSEVARPSRRSRMRSASDSRGHFRCSTARRPRSYEDRHDGFSDILGASSDLCQVADRETGLVMASARRARGGGPFPHLGEVGGDLLEVPGEAAPASGPGDLLHSYAAARALDSSRCVREPDRTTPQRQVPPAMVGLLALARGPLLTAATPWRSPRWPHLDHKAVGHEGHLLGEQLSGIEELPKYGGDAHGFFASCDRQKPQESTNPRVFPSWRTEVRRSSSSFLRTSLAAAENGSRSSSSAAAPHSLTGLRTGAVERSATHSHFRRASSSCTTPVLD